MAVLKKNTNFGGKWALIWSRRLGVAGSCYCWRRKQLWSSSKNLGDFSWFSCGLNLRFFWWYNIFHIVSYGIKILLWKSQWKLKEKRVSLNASIFFSWINPETKVEKLDTWWPVLQAFRRAIYYFTLSIKKYWGWKVISSKCTINYFHHLFFCVLQCRVCFHWDFVVHKRDQIWHAVAANEGAYWWS